MGSPAFIQKPENSDQLLVEKINKGDKTAFEQLFFKYYSNLCLLALNVVKSENAAEDVVQNVFLNIWKTHEKWSIDISLKAYLYRAVKNRAINYKKRQKNHRRTKEKYLEILKQSDQIHTAAKIKDSQRILNNIWNAVELLPERRRLAFTLHRKHGLTHEEISQVMEVSRKTVENHIGLALKQIREILNQKF